MTEEAESRMQAKAKADEEKKKSAAAEARAAAQTVFNEAFIISSQHKTIEIARLQMRFLGSDRIDKSITVQPQQRGFLLSAEEEQPIELKPGRYQLAKYVTAGQSLHNFACVCTVREMPVSATVILPDLNYLSQHCRIVEPTETETSAPGKPRLLTVGDLDGIQRAITNVGIRTHDGYFGTARLQMELFAKDPHRLMLCLQNIQETVPPGTAGGASQSKLEAFGGEAQKKADDLGKENDGFITYRPTRKGLKHILDYIVALPEVIDSRVLEPTKKITMADLYPLLQFELMRVVATAVRHYPAEDLYDKLESRENVERDIMEHMRRTLDSFGLQLLRVSAFQFISPAYQEKLDVRQKVALANDLNNERKDFLEASRVRRDIEMQDAQDELRTDGQVARTHAEEVRLLDVERQKAEDQKKEGEIRRLGMQRASDRLAKIEDAQADAEAKRHELSHAREAFGLVKEMMQFKADQEAQRMKVLAELPAEKLLPILMDQNPALQQAFIAAKNAESSDVRFEAERKIRDEISKLHGDNRDRTYALMMEAAKQIGHVTGKLADSRRPESESTPTAFIDGKVRNDG